MLIKNDDDVIKYAKLDKDLYEKSFVTLMNNKVKGSNHELNARAKAMEVTLDSDFGRYMGGTLLVIGDLVHKKAMGMFNYIKDGHVLQVNESGGYCRHDTFLEMWGGIVVDRLEKDSCTLPTDDEVIAADVLIIENDDFVNDEFYNKVKEMTGKLPRSITSLLSRDVSWVTKSIVMSNCIAFTSQFTDAEQLDTMMNMFSVLKDKEVIIKTSSPDVIRKHAMWEINSKLHKIRFI